MAELPERKEMSKRKHGKHLFSFGSTKKPPEKVASNVFYKKQSLYKLVSCNYKKVTGSI